MVFQLICSVTLCLFFISEILLRSSLLLKSCRSLICKRFVIVGSDKKTDNAFLYGVGNAVSIASDHRQPQELASGNVMSHPFVSPADSMILLTMQIKELACNLFILILFQ